MKRVVISAILLGIILAVAVVPLQHAFAMPAAINTGDGGTQAQNGNYAMDNHDKDDGDDHDDHDDNDDDNNNDNCESTAVSPDC